LDTWISKEESGLSGSPATNSSARVPGSARTKHLVALLCALAVLIPSCTTSQSSSSPSTCRGVQVRPGTDLQARIESRPRGTTFCFAKGLYLLSGTIWTGRKFPTLDLRAGAVIDGQNGGFIGITGPDGPADKPGTTILGGVFQHFGNAGAPSWVSPLIVRRNGVVKGTEFKENFNKGLAIQGSNARVSYVDTHHNGRYGLVVTRPCDGCPGPVGVIVEDSEIAFNNTRQLSTSDAAGGTKFSGGTDGMIVRGNEVHDNYGSGLWWDGFNRNAQVYGNVIRDNRNWGIFWELSYGGAKIHDNTLTGNGIGDGMANWYNNVQLLVSCSDGSVGRIEIYDNTIDGAAYPLGLINHSGHPLRTAGAYVHHNRMTLRSSGDEVGAVAYDGLTELFSKAANNRFDSNTYLVPDPSGAYWAWDGQMLTWSQWQAAGNDLHGAVQAIP
jgi:parallel beta-helix repeat protein